MKSSRAKNIHAAQTLSSSMKPKLSAARSRLMTMPMQSSGLKKGVCPSLLFAPLKKCYNLFMLDVRPSPIAGTWYEGNAKMLAHSVDEYINHAQLPALDGEVVAVIAPHAGHRYSGPVAGYAFAALRGLNPKLVTV